MIIEMLLSSSTGVTDVFAPPSGRVCCEYLQQAVRHGQQRGGQGLRQDDVPRDDVREGPERHGGRGESSHRQTRPQALLANVPCCW